MVLNNRSYGIMLHHFYSNKHPKGQGAISGDDLAKIIEFLLKWKRIKTFLFKLLLTEYFIFL